MDDHLFHRRVVSGDESALGELYDRFSALLYGLALKVTRDRVAAEDITQEVFATFWERPLGFDPSRGSLRTFLATVAHRRSVDHVRSEERRRVGALAPRLFERPHDLEEGVVAADEVERVREAVVGLPESLRQVIELAYYGGRTYREVAVEIGVPEGTAKSRIRLALRRLAETLNEEAP
ncbi:sigma-70 family RNA polymerase sigma factor [Herbidospora sp. NEAU-GS84]|uniref:Sigma-70 family RNA polymerase sigma factor n=1 Tax=Herbidospora solisilvae TaxID=2696284 RepID=A0A7C9MZY5_9ACTN|nr:MULTISPECIES: sigma-70 family RNA polymerase sigma factor [Herbidospora]NAS21689.1 sigma-70 family RNA polymerase sigma factor [Herbidospora solisilvae]GLX94315.1 DNA-directed RNA polymerase sigma-70 factor [Herbidospora sp. NBRC 101105]